MVRPFLATIPPWSGRPTDCLGGSSGGPKKSKTKSQKSKANAGNIEPNSAANNCWNNDGYDFANNAWSS